MSRLKTTLPVLLAVAVLTALLPQSARAVGAGSFTPTGSLATGREGAGAARLLDGRVLVGGGCDLNGNLRSTEVFDPAAGRFDAGAVGSLGTPRCYGAAAPLGTDAILFAGGYDGSFLSTAEAFAPSTGTFGSGGIFPMSVQRADLAAAPLKDGRALFVGGFNDGDGPLSTAEVFDPSTAKFTTVGPLGTPRDGAAAAPLPDGRILVVGGANDSDGALSSAEVFDPATNGFSPVGSMTSKRFAPAAAPLPGGRVLVVGGETETAQLSSAEVFDPATGTFSSAGIGSMSVPRAGPVATTLQDGRVLVAGGYYFDGSDHELATAEIFGATNTFTLKVRGKRLVVKVQASGSVLVADATTKLRAGAARRRPRLLAKPSRGSGGPPVISVKLRLSKFAKQRLRQKSKVKIRARVTFTPQGGLANSLTAKLKLRAKSKKK